MKRNASLITIVTGLLTGIQIIGQIIVARIFGARIDLDAFVSAVTIPTVLTTVIAGTLSDAFLPHLKIKQKNNIQQGNVYFVKMTILLSSLMLAISIALHLSSNLLLSSLFGARGIEFVAYTDKLMLWMIYTLPFSVVNTVSTSYLYTKGKFLNASVAALIGSILNLALIILLSSQMGIWSMVVAFIASIFVQFFIVFPYTLISYVEDALKSLKHSSTRQEFVSLFISWTPLIISALAVRFDNILIRSFSSRLSEGYIVYTNLDAKLFSGLVGIMTIGIQVVFFPHLIDLIHAKNYDKAVRQVNKAKLYGIALTLAIIGVILFIAPPFMRLLLSGGKFSRNNVELLISLFPYFTLPALGWGISQLFFQPIIAIGKQYYLTLLNVSAILLSWGAATIVERSWGGLVAISVGLVILTFTGIIGSEIIWQIHLKKQANH